MTTTTRSPRRFLLIGDSLTQFSVGTPRIFTQKLEEGGRRNVADSAPLVLGETCGGPGFGDALAEIYSRRCDVICRGFVGYNTNYFIRYALGEPRKNYAADAPSRNEAKRAKSSSSPEIATELSVYDDLGEDVALIFVCFGANDASDREKNLFKQHVALEDYETNLRYVVGVLRERCPNAKIMLGTPPPIHREKYVKWRSSPHLFPQNIGKSTEELLDRSTERVKPYAEAVKRCVASLSDDRVRVCDIFEAFMEATGGKEENLANLFSDGVHFTERGDELVTRTILATIALHFPEFVVTADPITKSFSNSGSKCEALQIHPECWDELGSDANRRDEDGKRGFKPFTRTLPTSRPYFLLIGDSITQQSVGYPNFKSDKLPGWGDVLNAKYNRRADVINRGLSGYNSRWTKNAEISIPRKRVAGDEDDDGGNNKPSPDSRKKTTERDCLLVTIFLGANDACLRSKQFVDVGEYAENLEALAGRARATFGEEFNRIIIIGPPPVAEQKYLASRRARPMNHGKSDEEIMDRSNTTVVKYSDAARGVVSCYDFSTLLRGLTTVDPSQAAKLNLPFVDLFDLLGGHRRVESELEMHLYDGLHLSGTGNRVLAEALLKIVEERFGEEIGLAPDEVIGLHQGPNSKPGRLIQKVNPWIQSVFHRSSEVEGEVKRMMQM